MTNKEFLIGLLFAHCPGNVDRKTVEVCFEIVNKYDWACFISQMGDYDHPAERRHAKEVMDKELYDFTHPFGTESYALEDVVAHITNNLKGSVDKAGRFYSRNFHHMNEEYNKQEDEFAEEKYLQQFEG